MCTVFGNTDQLLLLVHTCMQHVCTSHADSDKQEHDEHTAPLVPDKRLEDAAAEFVKQQR